MANDVETARNGIRWRAVFRYSALFVAAVLVAAWAGFVVCDTPTESWRTAGGILELGGLLVAAVSLYGKLAQFRRIPGVLEAVRRRFESLAETPPKTVLAPPPLRIQHDFGETVVERLKDAAEAGDALDARVVEDEEELEDELAKQREKLQRLERRLSEIRDRLRTAVDDLREDLEEAEIGDFGWEAVSVAWFVVGTVATTWPSALARSLPDLHQWL